MVAHVVVFPVLFTYHIDSLRIIILIIINVSFIKRSAANPVGRDVCIFFVARLTARRSYRMFALLRSANFSLRRVRVVSLREQ